MQNRSRCSLILHNAAAEAPVLLVSRSPPKADKRSRHRTTDGYPKTSDSRRGIVRNYLLSFTPMIRTTLKNTKMATFAILLPNEKANGMPFPMGTGFFVSPDGYFITAAHVLTENGKSDGPVRKDINKAWLMKEDLSMCQFIELITIDPRTDFALLKADFEQNKTKDFLKNRHDFPYIQVSTRTMEDGEGVYSFGYPLSSGEHQEANGMSIGTIELSPRTTSAIVSSSIEKTKMIMTSKDVQVYVLDKALNYGNSGGPIVSTETGNVHAICSRFQPLVIPQNHLGENVAIFIPSLYGIITRIDNEKIIEELKKNKIEIVKK